MKRKELEDYQIHGFTLEGEESLIDKINPILKSLVLHLLDLPENASKQTILNCFKNCMLSINNFEDEIETIERESILEFFYTLGEIVNLDPASEYAEEWRGDW
ncbi:hypothetical protein IQK56_23355 [Pseudomonas sp. MAFF 301449]|uniref:Uncharacterized protein n=1 Tax=Pseudomonas cyclaminis TaxID=2781239 RepID=A0ABR9SXS1_9PSED|nr:hypothetical protein [Pseudomonas cyclaminis]MBE8593617.1 hypothetical protein [Pseudomonas cyclaminis]MBE8599110.1 hypothetical protein [Pseudomonas cyclaminis]